MSDNITYQDARENLEQERFIQYFCSLGEESNLNNLETIEFIRKSEIVCASEEVLRPLRKAAKEKLFHKVAQALAARMNEARSNGRSVNAEDPIVIYIAQEEYKLVEENGIKELTKSRFKKLMQQNM